MSFLSYLDFVENDTFKDLVFVCKGVRWFGAHVVSLFAGSMNGDDLQSFPKFPT